MSAERQGPTEPLADERGGHASPIQAASSSDEKPISYGTLTLDESHDPRHFSKTRRWICTLIVVSMTAMIAFSSSIHTAAVADVAQYFHVSREVSTLGVTTFLCGFGTGPLIFAPLSEELGRNPVYRVTFLLFNIFNMACALSPNIGALLAFRFLAGFCGSPSVTNSGGSITDMWDPKDRSVPLALFTAASFLGPVLAPIVGGFISQYTTWRWNYWLVLIMGGVVFAALIVFLPETYNEKLKRDQAKRHNIPIPKQPLIQVYKVSLTRPWIMLFTEPILFTLSIYTAFIYGILYLDFSAYPYVFETVRGWQPSIAGLAFLGIGVGMAIATVASPYIGRIHEHFLRKLGGDMPEARLPHLIFLAWLIPIGLFWFAWTSDPHINWAPSVVSGVPFGIGFVTLFLGIFSYLIDCYGRFSASALAANAVMRSMFGAGFPLFSDQMYAKLGPAWATSLLGFLAAAMAPLPFVFYKFGPALRARSRFHQEVVKQTT